MEQVFASDYEDVYKVKDGVMFHVKKYRRVYDENGCSKQIYFEDKPKLRGFKERRKKKQLKNITVISAIKSVPINIIN